MWDGLKNADGAFSFLKLGSVACAAIAVGVILGFCAYEKDELFSLLALAGGVAGWAVGIIIVPFNPDEKRTFSEVTKVVSGFITGYLLSKIDPLVTVLVGVDNAHHAMIGEPLIARRALVTFCSFLVTLLTVFCARAYWTVRKPDADDPAAPADPAPPALPVSPSVA